jgi:2-polyprenyl-3-methyl-5-hydroxy-6-metoxy-1,4-benzoquinol methylase
MSSSWWGGCDIVTIEKMFDMSAKSYDKTEEVRFKSYFIKLLENTKKYLAGNEIVLDYGCATGAKALELAGHVKTIQGIDISSNMIEAAKRKAARRHIENVEFTRALIFDERYTSEPFDVIMAFNILHLLPDSQQAVRRIVDLLNPGGLFIANIPCLGEKMALRDKIVFSLVLLLMKIRLFPSIRLFTFSDAENVMAHKRLHILEAEQSYHELSNYFVVAKKIGKLDTQ